MPTLGVNRDAYHFAGSNQIDTGAVRQEEYRQKRIFAEMNNPNKAKPQTRDEWSADYKKNVLQPRAERRLALGTGNSSAHVEFAGKSYTLPPVSFSQAADGDGLFESQYGGLGATNSFYKALDTSLINIMRQGRAHIAENTAALKESKKLFARKPKPTHRLEIPSEDEVYSIFNLKLAESRIPLRASLESNGFDMRNEIFHHPSSESGDFLGEMKAWSDAHWKGIPEVQNRDWSKEIITSLPRKYVPI